MQLVMLSLKYCSLLLIPLLTIVVAVKVRGVSTPYFLFNYDPDYAYLFNSLSILDAVAPAHIHHPGTPVQLLGALIIKFLHPFESNEQIIGMVIENPEHYLVCISNVLIGLISVALFAAGTIFYRFTSRIVLSLLLQLSPLMFPVTIMSLGRVSPEPLLLYVSTTLVCLLILSLRFAHGISKTKFAKAFGWVSGFGVATKLTFIPIVFLPLTVLRSFKLCKTYTIYFFVGSFVFTLPFLFYPKLYYSFLRWLLNLFLGSGIYGQGERTIINPDRFFSDLAHVVLDQPLYSIIVVLAIGVYVVTMRNDRGLDMKNMFQPSLLLGLLVIHLFSFLVVAKHPQSIRNLIPALGLSSFTLVMVFLSLESLFSHKKLGVLSLQTCGVVVVLILICFAGNQTLGVIDKLNTDGKRFKEQIVKRNKTVKEYYPHCAQVHQFIFWPSVVKAV